MADPKFTIQEVVLNAVEDAPSYFLGAAITALLRYRVGQGSAQLEACKGYIDFLIKLEILNAESGNADS